MSYVDCSQLFRVSEKRQIYILLDCLRRRSVDRRCFNKLGMSFILAIDFPIGAEYALKNCNGGTLAMISKDFWNVLNVECNGRLRTGESVKKSGIFSTHSMRIFVDTSMEVIVIAIVSKRFLDLLVRKEIDFDRTLVLVSNSLHLNKIGMMIPSCK